MRPSGLAWKPQDLFPMQSWGDAQQRATAVAIPPLLLLLFSTLPQKKNLCGNTSVASAHPLPWALSFVAISLEVCGNGNSAEKFGRWLLFLL